MKRELGGSRGAQVGRGAWGERPIQLPGVGQPKESILPLAHPDGCVNRPSRGPHARTGSHSPDRQAPSALPPPPPAAAKVEFDYFLRLNFLFIVVLL